ncbi:MAG: transglutaminase family protein [Hyphomicrobiaceae bacterium]|nr:transglutaminase family protein [Hyphomicrobiaceae bacterium]MCC0010290.1 transglutaminase family protein [Hyphomicrobiaceae bacterium]
MKYAISHETTYSYSSSVHQSYHLLHLMPAKVPSQRILQHRLTISPAPNARQDRVDFFGNPITLLSLAQEHNTLVVLAESEIEVVHYFQGDLAASLDWQLIASGAALAGREDAKDVWQFSASSRHGPRIQEIGAYAASSFPPGRPVLQGCDDLMRRIFDDFTFDPSSTDVSTPVEHVFSERRGVCQDFAHLMISGLRSLGLPARYVSGYILTHPPEGQPKLQGADASHAWVSVWSPDFGWVDFDPTNNVIPRGEHVTFAYGRDYDDISPISGVLLGGGGHDVEVAVDVLLTDAV